MPHDLTKTRLTLQNAVGLSRNEAKTYLALVKHGSSKAGKVAKEAQLDRSSCYLALQNLIARGFATHVTIGKVKFFAAADPKNLAGELQAKLDETRGVLSSLEKEYATAKLASNVRLYKGERGVQTLFNMILGMEREKENRVFGSESQLDERMPLFAAKFKAQLERRKIKTFNLVRAGREIAPDGAGRMVRVAPFQSESPVVTNIFGDKIGIVIWSDTPEAILIDNKDAAHAYKEYFDFMWKHAKKA